MKEAVANGSINKLLPYDRVCHDWYRFVLSFPPHLVRHYLSKYGIGNGATVLDPFCGTGTTLVECKKLGIESVGVEAHPMSHFAGTVKTEWGVCPKSLQAISVEIAESAQCTLRSQGIHDTALFSHPVAPPSNFSPRRLTPEQEKLLLKDSISPLPLHKALVLVEALEVRRRTRAYPHLRLALAKALVAHSSNLHFGPEVGVRGKKQDAPVIEPWLNQVNIMASDLREVRDRSVVRSVSLHSDAREIGSVLPRESVDFVITSPPYPNEKDYTRTTRLESVLLGFLHDRAHLRQLKQGLMRSNTRNVYKADDDDAWIAAHDEINDIARRIEERRIELGKTSGFERLYHRVTKLYFGGMARHLSELRAILRPGARLAYVVGDQASYLQVMIQTGRILGTIADSLGYTVEGIDLFRTRLATATRCQLNEEVLVLKWPERKKRRTDMKS